MIIPLPIHCAACEKINTIEIELRGRLPDFQCSCGHTNSGFLSNSVSAAFQILVRSEFEIKEREDYALSMVFSAMAFDCELARLHHKWTSIEHLEKLKEDISDEELDAILRKYSAVDKKIEHVGELLFPGGLDAFIKTRSDIEGIIEKGFPHLHGSPIAQGIQKSLFWPRNAILHLGKTSRTPDEANRSRNIAALGLHILEAMDRERRARSN